MPTMTRREALAGGAAMIVASRQQAQTSPSATGRVVSKGRLKQSVCRWCYSKIPLPEFFTAVAGMGLTAVDLLSEKEWPIAREHGLICSMGSGAGGSIADGLNVKANHEKILAALTRAMPIAAAQRYPT
jgi:hydroxypyruvate isomerase